MAAVTVVLEMPPDTVIPETFPVKVVLVTLPEKSSKNMPPETVAPRKPSDRCHREPFLYQSGKKNYQSCTTIPCDRKVFEEFNSDQLRNESGRFF